MTISLKNDLNWHVTFFGIVVFILLTAQTRGLSYERPNFVLILVDDAALQDFGVYGGEAYTPNIDQLAHQGTMFTNYHSSLMCAPARAMLLTGCDSHLAGCTQFTCFFSSRTHQRIPIMRVF